MSRVLVSGADGFVASGVIPALVKGGHLVVGGLMAPNETPWLEGIETRITGEIGPETDWREILSDIDCVVHLAARVHVMAEASRDPLAENRRINTEGTRKLALDAKAVGVMRIVFLSTIKVNGEATNGRPFIEADPPGPEDPYAISKWEAEKALAEMTADGAMDAVVIRPPLVYGPGVKGNFLKLITLADKGLPLPIGAIDNRRSFVALDNLADAVAACVTHPEAGGRTYLVSDGEAVSTPELVRRIADALGRPAPLLPVPVWALRLAGVMTGKAAAVDRLTGSLVVDSAKIGTELDLHAKRSMMEVLRETATWYRSLNRTKGN